MPNIQIKQLFERDISRTIQEVIKVDEVNAERVYDEIAEYVVTDGIRNNFRTILHKYWEAKKQPTDNIGIWVSGFYGSGKSSFAKLLGLALQNQEVQGESVADLVGKRTADDEVQVLLKQITEHIPTEAVIFDVSTERGVRHANQSIIEIMYRLFLKNLGYAEDLDLAQLEINLEEEGKLERFKEAYEGKHEESWDKGRNKVGFALVRASGIMHDLEPNTYTTPDSWQQASKNTADINAGKLAERCRDLMSRRSEHKNLVFVIDEIGQFITRDVQKMLDLQGVVQSLGRISKGKSWLIVTSQEKLTAIVSGLNDRRVEYARLKDRFPIQVHLEPSDIAEVTHKRVLSKNAAGEQRLRELFTTHSGRLTANTKLSTEGRESYPELSVDRFMDLYPLLPYQVELMIQVISGLRSEGAFSEHVGGANRTVIKLAQQLLIHDKVGLATQPVGTLAKIDQIYDLIKGNIRSEIRGKIDSIEQEVEHPYAQPVSKAICLLKYAPHIHCTAENIAGTLQGTVDGDSALADVQQALKELVDSKKVLCHDGQYRIPTPAEDDWETRRASTTANSGDVNRLHAESVTELWTPTPSHNLRDAKNFKAGLTFNDRPLVTEAIPFNVVFVPAGDGYTARCDELRQRSQQGGVEIFWVAALVKRVELLTQEVYRSKQMISRTERTARTRDETALVSQEKLRLRQHQSDLKRLLGQAMLDGTIYFRGNDRSPEATSSSVGVGQAANNVLKQVLPDVYHRFDEGAVRVTTSDLTSLLTSESLHGISDGCTQLNLVRDENGQPVINTETSSLKEVLACIETKTSYGEIATGKYLIDKFSKEPFGWNLDVVRLFVVSLIRAGTIRATHQGTVIENVRSTNAKAAFSSNNSFKACSFQKHVSGTDITDWVAASEAFTSVFGKQLPEMQASAIALEIRNAVIEAKRTLDKFKTILVARDFPGTEVLTEALNQIRSICEGTDDDAITTFNAAHNGIKAAIKRSADLKLALTEPALVALTWAQAVLNDAWPFLETEPDLPDGLAGRADTLTDLLAKETFFRELAAIDQAAAAIRTEYEARRNAALTARTDAYAAALTELHAHNAWGELNEEQQERVDRPLKSKPATTIPQLRSELDACPQLFKVAVREMLELIEGTRLVTIDATEFFSERIETEEQLDATLVTIKQKVEKLLGQGKKVLLQ